MTPVPLPQPGQELLSAPTFEETVVISRGTLTAAAGEAGPTEFQRLLVAATSTAMTGHPIDGGALEPLGAHDLAVALAPRNAVFRRRILQNAILCGLVLTPLPEAVADQLNDLAAQFSVEDSMLEVARDFSRGALGLAAVDFDRNGYTASLDAGRLQAIGARRAGDDAWQQSTDDPDLHARWAALGDLPDDTLGKQVFWFYRARGFEFPGGPGSAPPLLAQHDWVHVLADYGTTLENELEVFALVARANDAPQGFSLLAMVVSLFETGYLAAGAGLFEASRGHFHTGPMAVRVADALRRGALARTDDDPSVDFLATDWFALAHLPVDDARRHFHLEPKSSAALAAGSVGPWAPGGISPFQWQAGHRQAETEGRPYDAHGAALLDADAS